MAREFNVPPVIFPSGGITNVPHQRRPSASAPTPSFQPPRPSSNSGPSPNLPFMSFDFGAAQPSSSSFSAAPVFSSNTISYSSFDEEPPLLEELGINTRQIWRKTVSILNPFRVSANLHEDADLSGPFLFLMAFARRNGNLDLYRCLSLVGYCILPMVIFSAISLFVPRDGFVIFAMGAVFVLWSTRVCTFLLVELASCGVEHRGLIAYACWLVYMLFSLLVIF